MNADVSQPEIAPLKEQEGHRHLSDTDELQLPTDVGKSR